LRRQTSTLEVGKVGSAVPTLEGASKLNPATRNWCRRAQPVNAVQPGDVLRLPRTKPVRPAVGPGSPTTSLAYMLQVYVQEDTLCMMCDFPHGMCHNSHQFISLHTQLGTRTRPRLCGLQRRCCCFLLSICFGFQRAVRAFDTATLACSNIIEPVLHLTTVL